MPRARALSPWRLVAAALAPLPATAVGMALARADNVSLAAYVPNLAAIFSGLVFAAVVLAMRRRQTGTPAAVTLASAMAALGIAATLLGPARDGVHRWVAVGPLRLNMSAALAPWLVLALASPPAPVRQPSVLAVLPAATAIIAQVIHVAQPDAGQATALAAAAAVPLVLRRVRPVTGAEAADVRGDVSTLARAAVSLALLALAAASWCRADPLTPVDHVERVLFLAPAQGAAGLSAVVLAGLALLGPFLDVLLNGAAHPARVVALTSLSYLLATFAVTFAGHFPVPIFGAGAGPVLGWYAFLAGLTITSANAPERR